MRTFILIAMLSISSAVFAASYQMPNAKQVSDKMTVGGQPTLSDLDAMKQSGVTAVISLRAENEFKEFDEAAEVQKRDMFYLPLPIAGKDDITFENAHRLQQLLLEVEGSVVLHCGSSNRVGALLALNAAAEGKSEEDAIAIGKSAGLSSLEPVVRTRIAEKK